jgi:hypothetical protein
LDDNTGATEKRIEIFYFDAGGGHRNAMTALTRLIEKQHPGWTVTPVDLQNLLEPIDPVYRMTRLLTGSIKKLLLPVAPTLSMEPWQAQDIYNSALKRGVTTGIGTILPVLQRFITRFARELEALLMARWKDKQTARPDIVVSVIPNFNWIMFGALRRVYPDVPYLTVITDMLDCPPHFWMEDQDQYMICGTARAYQQAMESGFYKPERVRRVSGMILRENFYLPPPQNALTRESLGLHADKPTALVMFGGNGSSSATNTILEQFEKSGLPIQTIVMCGNNKRLQAALENRPGCCPVGFVSNVADYMRLADFFIGKPGPGSISEAIHMGLPVIVEKNANTMPQERPNPDWVANHGAGIVVKSFKKDVATAARKLLSAMPVYKAAIKDNIAENRAVFEIVDILADILNQKTPRA